MQDPDRLFRRYQTTRDPARIAEVFDQVAPRLLRLAIHLVGRADEAEDLVQETFLAAIERVDDFEPARELVPWLSGILANRARYAKRRAARAPEPERLRARLERTPLEEAEGAEVSGVLAKALDRLEEPYRRALVLRLRHGLSPADIAHALDESPGAVRVRLHRGLEKLRRLLPSGFASSAFLLVEPARGLDAIREVVVAKATAASVAGTSSLALGGVLMSKKLVLAAVVIALVAVVAAIVPWPEDVEAEGENAAAVPTADVLLPAEADARERVSEASSTEAVRTALPEEPAPSLVFLRGRVVDALTNLPVADATIELHAPTSHTLRAIKEEAYDHLWQQNNGGSIVPMGRCPRPPDESWEAMRALAGGAPDDEHTFYGRIGPGSEPLSVVRTDVEGWFELEAPVAGGTLRCMHDEYATRDVAAANTTGTWTIALHSSRSLTGRVVSAPGVPIGERVELLFWTRAGLHTAEGEDGPEMTQFFDSWTAETDDHGTFDVMLPASEVNVDVCTPHLGAPTRSFTTGTGEDVELYVRRVPFLHVTDAETGAGIEHFAMIGRESAAGNVRWAGRFYARDGRYDLFRNEHWLQEFRRKPFAVTVWAKGHLPLRFDFTDLPSAEVIDAALARGVPPAVGGEVRRAGEPASGVLVQLQPFYPLQWRSQGESTVDAQRTDDAGRFRLEGPEGEFLLRIEDEGRIHVRVVSLPHEEPFVIDLARLAEIDVLVADANGTPQLDHTVVLGDEDGRSDWKYTDETGHVVFRDLPPGLFQVRVPPAATKRSFGNAIARDVELMEGAHEAVRVEVQGVDAGPRRPRVVTVPPTDVATWRARAGDGDYEWQTLEADGTIPIDLQTLNWGTFEIEGDSARRWKVTVPIDAPDGHEIRIALDGPRYEGVLLDLATGDPLSGVRVVAHAGRDLPAPSAVTDEEGRFIVLGGSEAPHLFTFNSRPDAASWADQYTSHEGVSFRAIAPPGEPTVLEVRVPHVSAGAFRGLRVKHLSGHVRRAADGEPLVDGRIFFHCEIPGPDGTLELWTSSTTATLGADGAYALELPDTPRYRVEVYGPDGGPAVLTETWGGLPGAKETRDFVVE